MYHKKRRRRRRFYPEFYENGELEANDVKLSAGGGVPAAPPQNTGGAAAAQEIPANYNDLLYPNKIRPESVFKQLENMQRDYIKRKLEISRANNIRMDPDVTGSDNNINRNEAENINNEIRIEIPDDMYVGEIHSEARESHAEPLRNEPDLAEPEYILTPDSDDGSERHEERSAEDDEHGAPDFEHIAEPDEPAEQPEPTPEVFAVYAEPEELAPTFEHFAEPEELAVYAELEAEELAGDAGLAVQVFAEQPEPEPGKFAPTFEHIAEPEEFAGQSEPEPKEFAEPEPAVQAHGITPFDRDKAIEYAHRWALDRNPSFLNFDELGGDCTNYVSQILLAGGCPMDYTPTYGWYYTSGSEKSPSWTGVEQLYNYLVKDKERGIVAREISAEEAAPGDIVQLSFNNRHFQHTPFIVEVTREAGEPFSYDQIKINAHSFDSQNRALDTYKWRKIRFIRVDGHK